MHGYKRGIRILLGVVASTWHAAEQIGRVGQEDQLVLGDEVLFFGFYRML